MPPKKQAPPPVEARIDGQSGTLASAVRKSVVEDFSTKLKHQADELRAENQRLKEALATLERETETKVASLTQENAQLSYQAQENQQVILGYEQQIQRLQAERATGSNEMLQRAEQEKVVLLERIARLNSENDKSSDRYLEAIQERDQLKGKCTALLQQLEELEEGLGRQRLEHEHLQAGYDDLQNKIVLLEQQSQEKAARLPVAFIAEETVTSATQAEDTDESQNEQSTSREALQARQSGASKERLASEQLNAIIDESKSTISKLRQNLEREQQRLHQCRAEIEQLSEMQMQAEDKYSAYQQTIDGLQAQLNKIWDKSNAPSLLSENYSANAERNEPSAHDAVDGVTGSALTPLLVQHALSQKYAMGVENVDYNKMRKEMQDLRDQLSRMDVLKQDYDVLHDEYLLQCEECARLSADRKRMQQELQPLLAPTIGYSAASPTLLESRLVAAGPPADPRIQEQSAQKSVFRSPSSPFEQRQDRDSVLQEQLEQPEQLKRPEAPEPESADLMLQLPDYKPQRLLIEQIDAQTQAEEAQKPSKRTSRQDVDLDRFYVLPKPKHFDKAQQCDGCAKPSVAADEQLGEQFARCSTENAELKATIAKMQRMAYVQQAQAQPHVQQKAQIAHSCALCKRSPAEAQLCASCLQLYNEAARLLPSVPVLCDPEAEFTAVAAPTGTKNDLIVNRTRAQLLEEQILALQNENAGLRCDFQRLRKAAKLVKAEYERGCDVQRAVLQCCSNSAVREAAELGDVQRLRELSRGCQDAQGAQQADDVLQR